MATEKITDDDISELFKNLDLGDEKFDSEQFTTTASYDDSEDSTKEQKIKLYDFKSPDKFSKDQLRTIQMIYENFARSITTSLSTYLRKLVSIRVSSVDQVVYEQFTRTVNNPSLLAIIDMYPLKGSAIMEIPPSITFAIVDRILGGEGKQLKEPRELTDIEISIMEVLIQRLLASLREVWYSIIQLKPRLENIESNVQFVQIVPANDTVLVINLGMEIGETEGSMLFCFPYITLESITGKLFTSSIYQNYTSEEEDTPILLEQHISNTSVDLSVILGEARTTFGHILNLKVGDYLMTDRKTNSDLDLKIGKVVKYKVVPGKVGKSLGVKVTKKIKVFDED